MKRQNLVRYAVPPLVPMIVTLVGAEVAVQRAWVASFLVPAPSSVLAAIIRDWSELWRATLNTTVAALIGFGMSIAIGSLIATALFSRPWVRRALYPYAVFFQTVPIVAIAPLLVIWFGWDRTVVASAFIVSIFPVIANTLTGLLSTDPALCDLFQLYDAKRWATLYKLHLPFALPQIFTGLRIAAGLAVIGAIVGEFITGSGIGGSIMVSRQQSRVDKVFAGLLLASLVGIVIFTAINVVCWFALRRWHASEFEH